MVDTTYYYMVQYSPEFFKRVVFFQMNIKRERLHIVIAGLIIGVIASLLAFFVMIGCLMFLGCPFRMILRLAGGGPGAKHAAVLISLAAGLIVGAAFAHNFGLASSAEGPTANGKIAVVIGLAAAAAIGCLNTFRKKA